MIQQVWVRKQMHILIADDHPIFREGLRHLVGGLFAVETIVEAGDMTEVQNILAQNDGLDLVILDIFFPGFNVRRDFKALRRKLAMTPIIAVSMTSNMEDINAIVDHGANGFISKSVKPDVMKQAILDIMQGERIVRLATGAITIAGESNGEQNLDERLRKLSKRQLQVLKGIAEGKTNKEIAITLEISHNTVRIHVSALLKALEVSTRSAAASFAAARGFG